MTLEDDELLTPAEAKQLLCVHWSTLDRMVKAGKLPAQYLPSGHRRFKRADVRAALAGRITDIRRIG